MSNSQFSLDGKLTRQNIYQKLKKYQVTKRKKKPKFIYCLKNPSKLPIWTFSIYKSSHNSVSSNLNYNPENNPQLRNVDSFEIFHVREELYLKIQYNTQKQTKTRNIDSLKKKNSLKSHARKFIQKFSTDTESYDLIWSDFERWSSNFSFESHHASHQN